jgi:selenide,water dikinase
VYRWEGGPALVQTVDFFTPIVDDPFTYGQIAAANALSDVYAMGGRPLTALAIAAFPQKELSVDVIREVFAGGHSKLDEAGVALLGGHTIQDPEVKFGYAVTGAVDPRRMLSNAGARPGDLLLLTKALGTGVVGTAIKFGRATPEVIDAAVDSMRTLNRAAAEAIAAWPADAAHACTDVTGFGLIGHASGMAAASQVTIRFEVDRVPLLPGVWELVRRNRSGGLATNEEHYSQGVRLAGAIDPDVLALLYDPQTSGGLLLPVEPRHEADAVAALERAGVTATLIGRVEPLSDHLIVLE